MKKYIKIALLPLLLIVGISGCQEGPAEKKGKQIDETVQDVKDNLQNKGPAQKAGEKLDDASGN